MRPIFRASFAVIALLSSTCVHAVNGPWMPLYPSGSVSNFNSIATNGSVRVVVGADGVVARSTDGTHWKTVRTGYEAYGDDLLSVIWTGSQFVAVGEFGTILMSSDGSNWTGYIPQAPDTLYEPGYGSVAYGDGVIFAAASATGDALLSSIYSNGAWSSATGAVHKVYGYVVWNGGQFYGDNTAGALTASKDGVTWSTDSSYPGEQPCQLASNGSKLLVVDTNSHVYATDDGTHWSDEGVPPPFLTCGIGEIFNTPSTLAWTGKEFILATETGQYYSSSTGAGWTSHAISGAPGINDVLWDGTQYIAVGDRGSIETSPDASTWSEVDAGAAFSNLQSLVWTGSTYVASVSGNSTSSLLVGSGSSWSPVAIDASRLAVANGQVFAMGVGTEVSTDGTTWNPISTSVGGFVTAAGDGANTIVLMGNSSLAVTQPVYSAVSTNDGSTWTKYTLTLKKDIAKLIYAKHEFIGVTSNAVVTSSDGINWNESNLADNLTDITYGGNRFVVVSSGGYIFTSSDGVSWQKRTIVGGGDYGTPDFQQVVWDGDEYLARAFFNPSNTLDLAVPEYSTLWESDDGTDWYPELTPPGSIVSSMAVGAGVVLVGDEHGGFATASPGKGSLPTAGDVSVTISPGGTAGAQLTGVDPAGRQLFYQFPPHSVQFEDNENSGVDAYLASPTGDEVTLASDSNNESRQTSFSIDYFVSNGILYAAPAHITYTISNNSSGGGGNGGGSGSSGGGAVDVLTLMCIYFLAFMRRHRASPGAA